MPCVTPASGRSVANRINGVVVAAFLGYAATIPLANWMIDHIGTEAFPGGPHTIPVGFGYQAPSGVLMIGLALVMRDAVHKLAGKKVALLAILVGVLLSYLLADPAIATASAVAFALSESLDFAVFVPLAKRSHVTQHHTETYGTLWSEAHKHGIEPPPGQIRRWSTTSYRPGWMAAAVLLSGAVGALVDSFVFLQIAFGSTMFWQGQVLGKMYFSVFVAAALWFAQKAVGHAERGRESYV
jgi:uncharacterized PurR-regulated membrane protein YhhQ (DUF165 family)